VRELSECVVLALEQREKAIAMPFVAQREALESDSFARYAILRAKDGRRAT
jgi:hypothetical protein